MKKQSIVLLITLFFISSISIIILKNLDDSKKFIDSAVFDTTLTQLNISNKNIEEEVKKLINKNKDDIDNILEITSLGIPLSYHNIDILLTLDDYSDGNCNINTISKLKDLRLKCTDLVDNIEYQDDFIRILNYYKPIENKKQFDFFIDKYINETQDNKINSILDSFSFLDLADTQDNRYLQCDYEIDYNNIKLKSSFIYNLNDQNTIYKQYVLIN